MNFYRKIRIRSASGSYLDCGQSRSGPVSYTHLHEELLKELEYLRAENAYLKKLQALVEERIVRESGKEPKPGFPVKLLVCHSVTFSEGRSRLPE